MTTATLPLTIVTKSGVTFVADARGYAQHANQDASTALVIAGQLAGNQVYSRGSKTERVKTARLVKGQQVLTAPSGTTTDPTRVAATQTKTGSTIRTVDRLEAILIPCNGFTRSANREYTVHFTDGTRSQGNYPIYTWHALAAV